MPTPKSPYPAEFRRQMVELVQAGRKPTQLVREFNVTAQGAKVDLFVERMGACIARPQTGQTTC